jgi:cobalt-zinc-cadmium efflux system outer membrane protein
MHPRRFCLLMIVLGVVAQLSGQSVETLTINQAVDEALKNNLNFIAQKLDVSMAEAQVATARLRPNPVLTLDADHLDLLGTGFSEVNAAGPEEYSVRADYLIEMAGKRGKRIQVAQLTRDVTQQNLVNAVRTLILDVQNACVDLIAAKQSLQLARESHEALKKVSELNRVRVKAGDLAQVELARAELAELQSLNAVRQAEAKWRASRIQLQVLLRRSNPNLDVSDSFTTAQFSGTETDAINNALTLRPDIHAMRMDVDRASASVKLQLAQGKVDLTLGSEFRRQDGVNGRGNSLGFFLAVPLPVFNRNQGEVTRARLEQQQLTAKVQALEDQVTGEVRTTYDQYATAHEVLSSFESDALGRAKSVRETMDYSYRRGEASLLEFLDATRAYNDLFQSYIDAEAEYAHSYYGLQSVSGKDQK